MEITGVVKVIGETATFGDKGFRKRELVITTQEQYPQHILIEFVQNNCELLSNFIEGQEVKVGINLRGREWVNPEGVTKYFNSLQGWRISNVGSVADEYQNKQTPQPPAEEEADDLPF